MMMPPQYLYPAGRKRFRFIYMAALMALMLISWVRLPGQGMSGQVMRPEAGRSLVILPDTLAELRTPEQAGTLIARHPDSAIRLFSASLRQSLRIGYTYGIVASLMNIGTVYAHNGRSDHALHFFREALAYNRSGSGRPVIPPFIIHNTIFGVYRMSGRYEQALHYYQQALISGDLYASPAALSSAYLNIAFLLIDMGATPQALYYMTRAERVSRQAQDARTLRSLLTIKGAFYGQRKEWDKSERYFRQALDSARAERTPSRIYAALQNMAALYLLQNMPQKALPYLTEAKAFAGDVNIHDRISLFTALGDVWFLSGQYRKAASMLSQALLLAGSARSLRELVDIHYSLAGLYAKTGEYRKAYQHLEQYTKINDSVSGKSRQQMISQLEVKYRLAAKDKALALQQAELRQKNLWIAVSSAGALLLVALVALLLSLYRNNVHQRHLQARQIDILQQRQELLVREQDIQLLKARISGEERERNRIARELHDNIGGRLAAIRMQFNVLRRQRRDLEASADFRDALQQLDETAGEIRQTAHTLMPEILLERGLAEAVQIYCEKMGRSGVPHLAFQLYSPLPRLEPDTELSIYRMVQELVQNIIKHAGATQAIVQLGYHDGLLSITVEDNGRGLPEQARAGGGMGLRQIRSRVAAMNGHFDIRSRSTGTTAYLELDIRKPETASPSAPLPG